MGIKGILVLMLIIVVVVSAIFIVPQLTTVVTTSATIKTVPSDCDIIFAIPQHYSYSKNSGTTGAVFYLPSGLWTITVSKSGYTTYSSMITASGTDIETTITLLPTSSQSPTTYPLAIVTDPSGCSVTINGQTKDSGTYGAVFDLVSGEYSATVSRSGYATKSGISCPINGAPSTVSVTLSSEGGTPNHPPVVTSITIPTSLTAGIPGQFVVNATDPDGDTLVYRWDFGDGTSSSYISSPSREHTYLQTGKYALIVTARDTSSATGSDSIFVTVTNTNSNPSNGTIQLVPLSVTFVVQDASGKPISGADVAYIENVTVTGSSAFHSYTDVNGKATITPEKGHSYQIAISKNGFKGIQSTVTFNQDTTVSITLASSSSGQSSEWKTEFNNMLPLVVTLLLIIIFTIIGILSLLSGAIVVSAIMVILIIITAIISFVMGIIPIP